MIGKRNLSAFLIMTLSLAAFSGRLAAQGWSFTFDLVVTGPCGSYAPVLPTFTITTMSSQAQCESVRSAVAGISASQPMYDSYGNYIGDCTAYYSVTPCTGADISSSSDYSSPGSVSIDGSIMGYPFFSPHDTKVLENWYNDYLIRLRSMGINFDFDNFLTAQEIPLTGDTEFDEMYATQLNLFTSRNDDGKPEADNTSVVDLSGKEGIVDPNDLKEPSDGTGNTVMLLTSAEEQRKRDEWYQKNGFNDMAQAGSDNSIDSGGEGTPGMSVTEATLRALIGQSSGAASIASDFILNTLDNTLSGITSVVSDLKNGNDASALQKAEGLSENVAINSAKSTGINYVNSLITGGIKKKLFPLVPGSETVYKVSKVGTSIWGNMNKNNNQEN